MSRVLDVRASWEANTLRHDLVPFRRALFAGQPVKAELVGPHHCLPAGTIVDVRLAGPTDLYEPMHPDGTPLHPDAQPGYVLVGAGWQVSWSGGGFFNPHLLMLP